MFDEFLVILCFVFVFMWDIFVVIMIILFSILKWDGFIMVYNIFLIKEGGLKKVLMLNKFYKEWDCIVLFKVIFFV